LSQLGLENEDFTEKDFSTEKTKKNNKILKKF
jgi:hypothetical protein